MQFGFSLRNLSVLCVSAVILRLKPNTAETQRTLRLRRELKLHQYSNRAISECNEQCVALVSTPRFGRISRN